MPASRSCPRWIVRLTLSLVGVLLSDSYARANPNVVVIISDDAGYADFGFMNGLSGETSEIPTPNLDALAARGVKFSSAYTAMVCSPSRAALVTGGYQHRIGYEHNINNKTLASEPFEGVPVETETIWDRMKSVGYTTGAIGKWHLGSHADSSPTQFGNRPERQGVDEFYGVWRGSRNYDVGSETSDSRVLRETTVDALGNVTDIDVEQAHSGEDFTQAIGQYAVDFIGNHHNDANPFMLYQSFTAPHTPLYNSPHINDPRISTLSGNRKKYASMMLTMDEEIGRILGALDDPNNDGNTADSIADDTLVVFINDNGGSSASAADNGQLRDFKGSPYEGGIRVPMIVAGAGVSAAAEGTTYDRPVHSFDILPTAFTAGGGSFGPSDTGIDGVDLLPYINGTNTADPHDTLVLRRSGNLGVRMGDWKMVKRSGGSFELYNLASDIGESSPLDTSSGPHQIKLAEMQRALTDEEVQWDKPRFASLNQTEDTFNNFDHFTFRPEQGSETSSPGESLLDNPGFENGTQVDSDLRYTYAEIDAWSNDGNTTSTAVAARDDNAFTGSYRGILAVGRTPTQITDHLIALGEEFSISLAHNGQSGWNVGSDSFNVELFYLDGSNNEVILDTINIVPASAWATSTHTFSAIGNGSAVGQQLGIRFESLAGSGQFANLDEIFLGLAGSSSSVRQLNWSEAGAWHEGGTNNVETLLTSDSFAGARFEFSTTDTFSYVSSNNLKRPSGLEFMLNKIVLSGNFTGAANQAGTIDGNALLLTNDLDGVGPQIALEATQGGGNQFGFTISTELKMYDDLELTGDGTTALTISGVISDYFDPRSLTKSGTSTIVLTGANTYQGDTIVEAGTLGIVTPYLADSADVYLLTGSTFDLDFSGTDTIDALLIDGLTQALGTWGAIGSGAAHQSSLFTGSGMLLVSSLAGDFNGDGSVDGADFLEWQRTGGTPAELAVWQTNYGTSAPLAASAAAVPEPASWLLLVAAGCLLGMRRVS